VRALTRDSPQPIPQWAALEGCTAAVLMADHDDATQAGRQCARACGALTRVRSACLWRVQRACATPLVDSVALMAEYDDANQAGGQCACACGALTRVRRACLWRAQRACATPLPQSGVRVRNNARGQRDVAVCLTSSAASAFVVALVILCSRQLPRSSHQ